MVFWPKNPTKPYQTYHLPSHSTACCRFNAAQHRCSAAKRRASWGAPGASPLAASSVAKENTGESQGFVGFPGFFLCFSLGFFLVFPWFSLVFSWFSLVFLDFLWFFLTFLGFPRFFLDFLLVFPGFIWFSWMFPGFHWCFSGTIPSIGMTNHSQKGMKVGGVKPKTQKAIY